MTPYFSLGVSAVSCGLIVGVGLPLSTSVVMEAYPMILLLLREDVLFPRRLFRGDMVRAEIARPVVLLMIALRCSMKKNHNLWALVMGFM